MSFKRIAIISLSFNIAIIIFLAGKRIYFSHSNNTAISYVDMWNQCRVSVLSSLPIDTLDIVFVGNSLTEGFPLQECFHSLNIKNRGIASNLSRHIRERIGSIAAGHPRKIFLELGINDILNDLSLDSLCANYKAIIDTIRLRTTHTRIVAQTLTPLGDLQAKKERMVEMFNTWLKGFCQQQHIDCIDLWTAFQKKRPREFLALDDVHLNGNGYAIWKEQILPYIQ